MGYTSVLINPSLLAPAGGGGSEVQKASTIISDGSNFGTLAWTNPGNAAVSNDLRATADNGNFDISEFLNFQNFGFSIPGGSTIDGIVVTIERRNPDAASEATTDEEVFIIKNGTIGTTNRNTGTFFPATDTSEIYGSISDLWGETWTVANINAANFGFVMSANVGSGGLGQADAQIDCASIEVFFS